METQRLAFANENQRLKREAQMMLAEEVRELLTRNEAEGLQWRGTSCDLMEALHVAYETGMLVDREGMCLTFITIVRSACAVLHVAGPRNPYKVALKGSRRKGMVRRTYMERYQWMLRNKAHKRPFLNEVRGES